MPPPDPFSARLDLLELVVAPPEESLFKPRTVWLANAPNSWDGSPATRHCPPPSRGRLVSCLACMHCRIPSFIMVTHCIVGRIGPRRLEPLHSGSPPADDPRRRGSTTPWIPCIMCSAQCCMRHMRLPTVGSRDSADLIPVQSSRPMARARVHAPCTISVEQLASVPSAPKEILSTRWISKQPTPNVNISYARAPMLTVSAMAVIIIMLTSISWDMLLIFLVSGVNGFTSHVPSWS